jgi:hypothetical protein
VRGFSLAPRTAGSCIATRNSVNSSLRVASREFGRAILLGIWVSDHAAHSLYFTPQQQQMGSFYISRGLN